MLFRRSGRFAIARRWLKFKSMAMAAGQTQRGDDKRRATTIMILLCTADMGHLSLDLATAESSPLWGSMGERNTINGGGESEPLCPGANRKHLGVTTGILFRNRD